MRTFVVPLDGSVQAETALFLAHRVAQDTGGDLCLVRVSPPDEIEAATDYLESVAGRVEGVPVSTMVVAMETGERVATGITEAVEASGPDALLCLTLRGNGALTAAVIGSTTEDLLRDSDCAILVAPHPHQSS